MNLNTVMMQTIFEYVTIETKTERNKQKTKLLIYACLKIRTETELDVKMII